jgi:hypothetical protein
VVGQLRPRTARILVASLTAFALLFTLLGNPGHSRGAANAATQSSSKVAVVPGFVPKSYPGYHGVPAFPTGASQLSAYHFSQLSAKNVTAMKLASYDTVILYGIRWSDIPASGQTAINAFAATHKVLIWDADGTGPQNYASFIHPFADSASGENFPNKPNDSIVNFPTLPNVFASDNPSSPYYLDPQQLVKDRDELNDMNAMKTGTKNWVPALVAANKSIPNGGWPLAWSYGVIGNHTGLTVYSGIDADAFSNSALNPNYALKALALQLAAAFRGTPDPACAPGCHLPSSGGGSTYASCTFVKAPPKHWVHGRVAVSVKTSVAAGITVRIVTRSGGVIAAARERSGAIVRLVMRTKKLPSNRVSRLRAQALVNGKPACTNPFRLKVDNTPPRLLLLSTTRSARGDMLRLRVTERSSMAVVGRHLRRRSALIAGHRTIEVRLPSGPRVARLILRDRAGNTVLRRLVW